ncbi:MAG: PAS domain-containing protein [Clostridiales bacterium]|nr:PAS domain-containing protein [Clostridiales bacterium]
MYYKFLLESILSSLDEGVIVVDNNANITFYNEPTSNISGIEYTDIIGKNIFEVFSGLEVETSTFYQVLKTKKPVIDHIQTYTNYAGKTVKTVTTTLPLIEDGKFI